MCDDGGLPIWLPSPPRITNSSTKSSLGTTTSHETIRYADPILDFPNVYNSAGHSCLWAILRGLGVPDVDFLEALYSNSGMKIQVGTENTAPIQLDTALPPSR